MFETGNILLDIYLYFILLCKLLIIFIILFQKALLKRKILTEESLLYIRDKLHSLFIISMSILLIILFNPFREEIKITKHIKLFLFIFGILQTIQIINEKQNLKIKYKLI